MYMQELDNCIININGIKKYSFNVLLEETIKKFFENLDFGIYFFYSNDLNEINNYFHNFDSNKSKNLIFFNSDYNDEINLNTSAKTVIYRTGFYKSKKKYNEYTYPVLIMNDILYSHIDNISPTIKTDKPKICFCGGIYTYHKRLEWLEYLKNSNLLECNFEYKHSFRGGTRENLIDNMKTSEFCFCPRGTGNFSIRFYETLFYGRIPVILDTDLELPFNNFIKWDEYIVISNTIEELPKKIYDFWEKKDIALAQIECKNLFNEFFSLDGFCINALMELENDIFS